MVQFTGQSLSNPIGQPSGLLGQATAAYNAKKYSSSAGYSSSHHHGGSSTQTEPVKVPSPILTTSKPTTPQAMNYPSGGTSMNLIQQPNYNFIASPYIQKEQIGTYSSVATNYKKIPEVKYTYFSGVTDWKVGERPQRQATQQEVVSFERQINPMTIENLKGRTTLQKAWGKTAYAWESIQEVPRANFATIPLAKWEKGYSTGLNITESLANKPFAGKSLSFIPQQFIHSKFEEQRLTGGALFGVARDIQEQPGKQVVLLGAGFAVGAAVKGTEIGLGYIPKAGAVLEKGFRFGTIGAGLGLTGIYTIGATTKIIAAPNTFERGKIFGVEAKDFGLMAGGFAVGEKAATQTAGWFRTRGRTELPLERITPEYVITKEYNFPKKATSSQELAAFKHGEFNLPIERMQGYTGKGELIYPETYQNLPFKVPGGAYHATGNVFWGKGTISSVPGTSELPGLYGSYGASIHFTRLTGSSYNVFPKSFSSLLEVSNKPGIAFLQPKGFRINPVVRTKGYMLEEGGKIFNWGFKKSAKPGVADLPLMKLGGESEAVFRTGEQYTIISKEYYTKIKGIKVPIDVAKYSSSKGEPAKIFLSTRKGGLPETTSILTPKASLSKGFNLGNIKSKLSSSYNSFGNMFKGFTSRISNTSSKIGSYSNIVSSKISSYGTKSSLLKSSTIGGSSIFGGSSIKKGSSVIGSSILGGSSIFGTSYKGGSSFGGSTITLPNWDIGFSKSYQKLQKGKRGYKYTPSLTAVVFKIKGKQPKSSFTGLNIRPLKLK